MAIDLIKEYLVGIGFKVDQSTFDNANASLNRADKTIKKFNDDNKKGFSESNDSLKDLFHLLNSSSDTLGKLFPELNGPFKELIRNITLVKKLYDDFSKQKIEPKQESDSQSKNDNSNSNPNPNTSNSILPSVLNEHTDLASQNLVDTILDANNAAKKLAEEGGNSFKLFSASAIGSIATVVAAIGGLILAGRGLTKFLNGLAQQDIEYEKLSRQLWTTKETAKEVDIALKTLGVSMQDLWFSPTLLKQFNQLRKDSAALKLPKEYLDNIKIVQGIGLEFKRLQQLVQLVFQWIGNYILKYAKGPLLEIQQTLHEFTDGAIKEVPSIAKVIGSIIGILLKVLAVIIKISLFLFKLTSPIFKVIELIGKLGDIFESLPEPAKKGLKIIALLILALSSPILFIIGLLDDFITYINGGKSLIGSFVNKVDGGIDKLKSKFKNFKDSIKSGMDSIKDGWNYYYKKAVETFENIKKKAEEIWKDIKNFFPDLWEKAKDKIPGLKSSIEFFSNQSGKSNIPNNYSTSNTSSTVKTENSNNQISNDNKFYIYGGNDPKTTGDTVASRVSGINTRNLQGVY